MSKILCVGLCCFDTFYICQSYSKEDCDTRCLNSMNLRGGNASNNCTVLAITNCPVEFLGVFGDDDHLKFFQDDMRKYDIDFSHCPIDHKSQGVSSGIIISLESGSRTIYSHNPGLKEITQEDFDKLDLDDYAWIHFEGRNIEEVASMMRCIDKYNKEFLNLNSNKQPITVSVEVEKSKPDILSLMPLADIIFVSKDIATSKNCRNMKETLQTFSSFLGNHRATLISAWGELGAMARTSHGSIVETPAFPPDKIVNTCGAGDTFNAGVISHLYKAKLAHQKNFYARSETFEGTNFITEQILREAITLGCQLAGAKIGMHN